MYVYEETVDGKKLTDIINTEHENTKYLPGTKLPHNIVSMHFQVMDPVGIICGLVCMTFKLFYVCVCTRAGTNTPSDEYDTYREYNVANTNMYSRIQ